MRLAYGTAHGREDTRTYLPDWSARVFAEPMAGKPGSDRLRRPATLNEVVSQDNFGLRNGVLPHPIHHQLAALAEITTKVIELYA
ncbi:MAG: hypothetical protein QOC63_6050 [Mycobacterium sp.]|jgi:hypothetical protein|nr:hypothetical protein [Mycobacterium sp.]